MEDIILEYIKNDPRNNEYSDDEIKKAVDIIKEFINKLDNFRIEENGIKRELNQVEEFAIIYDFVSNRNVQENIYAHSIVGVLNSNTAVCEGFAKLAEVLCAIRKIPFLYKKVYTKEHGEHGNFEVIVKDENGIEHCLHCDPLIDGLNKKEELTYNAFLIQNDKINNFHNKQFLSCAASEETELFWHISMEKYSEKEMKEKLENVDEQNMGVFLAMIEGKTKQEFINEEYLKLKNKILKLSKFFGVEISNINSKEEILQAYQILKDKYDKMNIPLDRDELFETIKRVYRQKSSNPNIDSIIEQRIIKTYENEKIYWTKENNIIR